MKLKKLLSAAIAVSMIAMTAGISQAESPEGENFSGRGGNSQTRKLKNRRKRKFDVLNLTEEQKSKIKEIKQNYRDQIADIFTSEQKAALESAKQQGRNRRQVMKNLNLSSDQKQKIKKLIKSRREKIAAILTPEQKQKLQEFRQQRRTRRSEKVSDQ